MRNVVSVWLFLSVLAVSLTATASKAAELAREDIEEIVREYILTNPELLEEAFARLQQKREAEADAARVATLIDNRALIERNPLDPVLGNPAGDVTVVEFFDYNCGFCARAHDDMNALLAADPNLRVVLKEFPVLGQASMEAAGISIMVNKAYPQKYEEFHGRLLSNEGPADAAVALDLAEAMGMERALLEDGMRSDEVRQVVESSYDIAQQLGLSGTPSYVIGDAVEFGAVGVDTLRARINEVRCGDPTAC